MCFQRRKAPLLVLEPDSKNSSTKSWPESSNMANHGRYTREQEAETLVKVLSTMPHQDPRTSDRSGRRNRKPVIHDRVAEVLDELATICVSRPHQEPVAVGLQMQATEKKMTFVIAVERSLVKKTISHAKEVLKGLQELGHAYSKHRISVSSVERETSESSSEASVKSNGDYLPPELQKMELVWMAKIFRFSFAEIKHRLQKPCRVYFRKTMPRIDRFIELIGLLYPKLSDDHEVLSHFREVLTAMKVVKSILDMPSNHPDYKSDEAMSRLCGAMWYASYQATKIFGQEYWEAILADRLKIYGEVVNDFPLEKFMRRFGTLIGACRTLLYVVDTPTRYQQYLKSSTIDVIAIPTRTQLIRVARPIALESIHRNLLERCGFAYQTPAHPVFRASAPSKSKLKFWEFLRMARVHGECVVALYFLKQKNNTQGKPNVPAYSYIGLSKPSCAACKMFLATFRDHATMLYPRVSGGKLRLPWKYPTKELDEAGVPDAVKRDMLEMFINRLSLEFVRRAWYFDEEEVTNRKAKAKNKKCVERAERRRRVMRSLVSERSSNEIWYAI